jgi:uncharacterized protein (DUF2384 family)
MAETMIALLQRHYTQDEAMRWLESPHPQLDGATPQAAINRGEDARVKAILRRLDEDAYL